MTFRVPVTGVFFIACLHGHAAIVATDVKAGQTYRGACDASAVAPIDSGRFVVATDEMDNDNRGHVNRLHIYRRDATSPESEIDVTPAVQHATFPPTDLDEDKRECDFEGAARVNDRIFWITSHGPNSKGKPRPDRYRFIATDVITGSPPLRLLGNATPRPAYGGLFKDLAGDPRLSNLRLGELVNTPPESGGLNIEGLARMRDGRLLIALRSPLFRGQAVLVPLLNGAELVTGAATKANLGKPIFLDLESRGIRDIAYWQAKDVYILVAGSAMDHEDFAIYSWTTGGTPQKLTDTAGREISLGGLHPEAIMLLESGEMLLMSDDGDEQVGAKLNKELPSPQRTFRTISMKLVVR